MPELTSEEPVEKIKGAAQQTAKAETTTSPRRKYQTLLFRVALFLAIGAFSLLTFMVKTTPTFPIDIQITRTIQSINSPLFSAIMNLVSWPGFSPQAFIIPVLIVLFIYTLGLRWEVLTALVAALLPGIVNVLIKEFIRRPRPTTDLVHVFRILDSYSFPSGHVMFYVGFFGFLWFLILTLLRRSLTRTLLLSLLGSLILLVGISRIYLGQHWASDVFGAYLMSGITLAAILQLYIWGKKRFVFQQPAAPHASKSI